MRFTRWLLRKSAAWRRPAALLLLALLAVGYASWRWGRPLVAAVAARAALHSESPQAAYTLLIAMDGAGVEALVRNAVDPDPARAAHARRAVHTAVDTWRANTDLNNRDKLLSRIQHLTAAVDRYTPRMTESALSWAHGLTRSLLALTPELPPARRVEAIQSIDSLVATLRIQPNRPDLIATLETPQPESSEPAPEPIQLSTRERFAIEPVTDSTRDPQPVALPDPPEPTLATAEPISREPVALPESEAFEPNGWNPDWREGPLSAETPSLAEPAPPQRPVSITERFAMMTDRELLAELLNNASGFASATGPAARGPAALEEPTALDPEIESLRAELTSRGYQSVSVEHLRMLLSGRSGDRLALVDRLLTSRTHDAARMLFLLASDPEADVRLAAVTALGASNQQSLIEAAWSIALREADPRFAEVAERLHSRLR